MIKSMTGFGRSEYSDGKRNIIVEIRSVNHRYAEIAVKMPRRYSFAEEQLKAIVKKVARRGKIEVSIQVESLTEEDNCVQLNLPVAKRYYEILETLSCEFLPQIAAGKLDGTISLEYLSGLPDVMKVAQGVENEEEILDALTIAVKQGVQQLDEMRRTEGEKLAEDIFNRGELIRTMVGKIEERSPQMAAEYMRRLQERIKELIGASVDLPEDRILTEAAIFADKCNVTEEVVRLNSHINQLGDIIRTSSQPDGKKLDFLVQEMNREANTIGSKANDIAITAVMLSIKSEVEKIREQVQNIE